MGLYLLIILIIVTIGPIVNFHKGIPYDEDNKWALILPPGVCLIYGYCLITKQYETQTGLYILAAAFILSIYSSICSIVMYVQFTNRKANEANREQLKEEIKKEMQSDKKNPRN